MTVSLPTSADVRKVRKEAKKVVDEQFDVVRTPLLAWAGAGDLAYAKVTEAIDKARDKAKERRAKATERREKLQDKLSDLPSELRDNLTADELRKRYDDLTEDLKKRYEDATDEVKKHYDELAERGDTAVEKFRARPRVKRVLDNVSDANNEFEKRVEKAVDKLHDAGEELRDRVSKETRSAADEAAATTHSATGKTANPTAPKKPTPAKRNNGTAK